jgi:hypothetical protein
VLLTVVAVFAVGHRFLPSAHNRELEWAWWQHVLGNSYLLAALAFLVWSAQRAPQWMKRARAGVFRTWVHTTPFGVVVHGAAGGSLDGEPMESSA